MNKYDRLLFILNLLRSRKNLNADAIAKECGVTPRSIYRDIISLSEANVPIYYDQGYKMASDSFLPPLNFEYDEYQLLDLALASVPVARTGKYEAVAKKVRAKIESGLSEVVRRKSKFTPTTTHVEVPATYQLSQIEAYFANLEDAIQRFHRVTIRYRSIKSGLCERTIEPYFIAFRGRAFYCVAFCKLKNQFRTFRIDRIEQLIPLTETFDRDTSIDPETYFSGSWAVYTGEEIEVAVRFSGSAARVVSASQHHPSEVVEEEEDGCILYRVKTRGAEEIERWILGFGAEAEILEPHDVRIRVADTARQLVDLYEDTK